MVDECAVVRDYHYGTVVLNQEIFEPLNRFNVEVVGRLVEQQYVRFLQQHLCQLDAHSPAPREVGSGAVEIASREAKAEKGFLNILIEVCHVNCIELFAEGCHLFNDFHVFLAFVVGASGKLIVEAIDSCLHLKQM